MKQVNYFLLVLIFTRDKRCQTRKISRQSAQSLIIGLISIEKSLATS